MSHVLLFFYAKTAIFLWKAELQGHSFESGPSKDIPANLLFLSTRISEKKLYCNVPHIPGFLVKFCIFADY
jgi:hypothetical protein